jgi:beta-glucanase (GH16 family)
VNTSVKPSIGVREIAAGQRWAGALICVVLTWALAAPAWGSVVKETLFRDDFSGSTLDRNTWMVGTWDLGRARFGDTPYLHKGMATLRLHTYNPAAPGSKFLGTEILSKKTFSRGYGVEFEARMRLRNMPDGLVSAFYTFTRDSGGRSDEIDYELLSKWVNHADPTGDRVLATTWNEWSASTGKYFDNVHHSDARPVVKGLDLNRFNTFKIKWLPDHTEWLINGKRIHTTKFALADEAMPVKFNLWAANSSWADAFNAGLLPTANKAADRVWEYDIDYVVVRALPKPGTALGSGFGLLGESGSLPEPGTGMVLVCAGVLALRRRKRMELQI